jgi:hypothetical protein
MGIDIGKNSFQSSALFDVPQPSFARSGHEAQSTRGSRQCRPCLIGMEACVGAHQLGCKPWSRLLCRWTVTGSMSASRRRELQAVEIGEL